MIIITIKLNGENALRKKHWVSFNSEQYFVLSVQQLKHIQQCTARKKVFFPAFVLVYLFRCIFPPSPALFLIRNWVVCAREFVSSCLSLGNKNINMLLKLLLFAYLHCNETMFYSSICFLVFSTPYCIRAMMLEWMSNRQITAFIWISKLMKWIMLFCSSRSCLKCVTGEIISIPANNHEIPLKWMEM